MVAVRLKDGQDIADDALRGAVTDAGYTTVRIQRSDETLDAIRARVKAQGPRMIDDPLRRNLGLSFLTLVESSSTLVCCVLPAVIVSLGAGRRWSASSPPASRCGTGDRCRVRPMRDWRRWSAGLWIAAALAVSVGGLFAFVLPAL